ncbi:MAG: class I SAM-dependent methyltransferase [Dehalogenimonas sp.]|uniref:Class I SAM-dependent methyltransferase n=1 Tax=Candidatus Dehalogenimonas loeffleri TaxID=3127115 RepID=A0ABZ2J435_9CHLR|nr:class I SAM-dependent methyltransferase [Dehalogenimonas sp.]
MNSDPDFPARIQSYIKYLPGYPAEYIDYLINRGGLSEDSVTADIGAGAGILAKMISPRVKRVLAVEPDERMRRAAGEYLKDTANVTIIAGSAEATGLSDNSIDLITAGQAFHYFEFDAALQEFKRILKPDGLTALVWHTRLTDYPFGEAMENLLRHFCPDYTGGTDSEWPASRFFKNGNFEHRTFCNHRYIDLETLIGYALSMPFSPVKGDRLFPEFVEKLATLYDKYSDHGKLELRAAVDGYLGEI